MAKQIIILRKDLNMRKGKMVAQGAHASMAAILNLGYSTDDDRGNEYFVVQYQNEDFKKWITGNFKKICVGCDTEVELIQLYNDACELKLPCSLIVDSGLTEFKGIPTKTAVAIGPAADHIIDSITGHLKLL